MSLEKDASISSAIVLDVFSSIKEATDDFVVKNKMEGYRDDFLPRSDELAIIISCNATKELGYPIRTATSGSRLERVEHLPRYETLVNYMYGVLEKNACLIKIDGANITRTSIACPSSKIVHVLEGLLDGWPALDVDLKLMEITGMSFANCLSGEVDALQLLFGSVEGQTLMTNLYTRSPLFSTILVVYIVNDVSPVFVATAQKKLKEYPSVEFKVVDVEEEPDATLQNSHHMVICSNVIHAE
jgi:hypothetical protein